MKTQSLFIKTSMYFLIVLFHSALTISVVATVDDPELKIQNRIQKTQTLQVKFDGRLGPSVRLAPHTADAPCFSSGVANQSLRLGGDQSSSSATIELGNELQLDLEHDFSIEFWIRTTANRDQKFVLLSKKRTPDNSLVTQKQHGWAFYFNQGTWAWNIGSGNRRLTYLRDNGQYMAINDGRWHQLAMTFDHQSSLIRLYFDGTNWATYNIADKDGFDFSNDEPLSIGWIGDSNAGPAVLPAIKLGAENLQGLVDRFHGLGLGDLHADELMNLVIGPERLIRERTKNASDASPNVSSNDVEAIKRLTQKLSKNPYTVHQVADFMQVAPLLKLYRLVDGQIEIDPTQAQEYTIREQLTHPSFDIDELVISQRTLNSEELLQKYTQYFRPTNVPLSNQRRTLTAGSFNIHHGGLHETIDEDGWDSRKLIAEIIRRENVDVVMMQETYSSGDFIAAELGYYFATTVDWDYLNQGANISVLSRYPIQEIVVPPKSSFMNVAARIEISQTQVIQVMSNWYGMNNFSDVFKFHESRFSQSDRIPVLFAGDFNAVPHTDGGRSPASQALLGAGFRDAFREQYPDTKQHPGFTHRSGSRIDQLYFKGSGLKHRSTQVLSTWPSKFPSDHFLIKSIFELDFVTTDNK